MNKVEAQKKISNKLLVMEDGINLIETALKEEDLKEIGFQLGRIETLYIDMVDIFKDIGWM